MYLLGGARVENGREVEELVVEEEVVEEEVEKVYSMQT